MYARARLEQIEDLREWASAPEALTKTPATLEARPTHNTFSQFGDTAPGLPWNQFNNWAQNMATVTPIR